MILILFHYSISLSSSKRQIEGISSISYFNILSLVLVIRHILVLRLLLQHKEMCSCFLPSFLFHLDSILLLLPSFQLSAQEATVLTEGALQKVQLPERCRSTEFHAFLKSYSVVNFSFLLFCLHHESYVPSSSLAC